MTKKSIKGWIIKMIIFIPVLQISCTDLDKDYYGILVISMPSGKQVFFRRNVWGLHEERLVLSANKELDPFYDPLHDWDFNCLTQVVYYKILGDTLEIVPNCVVPPKSGAFPVKVKVVKLNSLDMMRFEKEARANGFKLVDVPVK